MYIFFFKISSGAIIIAAIIQYERLHKHAKEISFHEFYKKTIYKQNNVRIILFLFHYVPRFQI